MPLQLPSANVEYERSEWEAVRQGAGRAGKRIEWWEELELVGVWLSEGGGCVCVCVRCCLLAPAIAGATEMDQVGADSVASFSAR